MGAADASKGPAMTTMLPQSRTTLAAELARLAALDSPPPWHVAQPLIEAASRATMHVLACTVCDAWTPEPDDLGRCDQCAIACDGCARALDSEDDGMRTGDGRLFCEVCVADRDEDHGGAAMPRRRMPAREGGKVVAR